MKKIFFIVAVLAGFFATVQAQTINTLPSNRETRTLPDGWHKFQLQGVDFDVEVIGGDYQQGNVTWLDGSKYSGGLNGVFVSGRGTYTWVNGSKYEGSFKKGKRHGKGSLTLADGQKWSGKWKENKKNGKGKIFDKDGTLVQQGVWEDDKLVTKK